MLSSGMISGAASTTKPRVAVGPWCATNFSQNQTAVVLSLGTNAATCTVVKVHRAGSVIGIMFSAETMSASSGTLTADVYKNGSQVAGCTVTVQFNTNGNTAVFASGTHTFVAGDILGVRLTSSAVMNANGNVDPSIFLELEFDS